MPNDENLPTFGAFNSKVPPLTEESSKLHECVRCDTPTSSGITRTVDLITYHFCSLHCLETTNIHVSKR